MTTPKSSPMLDYTIEEAESDGSNASSHQRKSEVSADETVKLSTGIIILWIKICESNAKI